MPFLLILSCNEFDKMQIPYTRKYSIVQTLYYSLFGDDWNLRFCALITVGALFIFNTFIPGEKAMRKHRKKINQQIEDTEDDDFFVFESEEVRKRFIQKLWESVDPEFADDEEIENMERPPATKRHKIRMNRLFRERVGGTFLPFPEADNFYQRARSKIVIKLRINKLMYRWEARRRERRIKKYEKH